MSSQLETVRRVRKNERDQRQAEVAEALAALDMLDHRLHQLQREAAAWQQIRRRRGTGPVDVDFLASANRYRWLLDAQQQHFARERERLEAEVERRRAALVEAERAYKSIEKLIERRREAAEREQALRDQQRLDEAAGAAWFRREVTR